MSATSVMKKIVQKDASVIYGRRREPNEIPWIMSALNGPNTEIRPNDKDPLNKLNYLLVVEADPPNNLPQEYYLVVTRWLNKNTVSFVTAYPIAWRQWKGFRDAGPAFYPLKKKKDKR